MMENFPLLTTFVFAPLLGMLAVLCIPSRRESLIRHAAALAAAVPLIIGVYVLLAFRDHGTVQYRESAEWIGGLHVYYYLGIDGISAPLLVLSGLIGFIAVVASFGISTQVKGYFALLLLLLTGMNGVFCTLDFFLFYVFWEVMLLPMYFLIGIWGGTHRVYAALKFFLYTLAGSVLMLIVLLAAWFWSDGSYSSPEHVLAAKRATFEQSRPFIDAVRSDSGALSDESLAVLFAQHNLDRSGISDLRAYTAGLTSLSSADFDEAESKLREAVPSAQGGIVAAIPIPLYRTFNLLSLKTRHALFLGEFTFFGYTLGFATLMFVFLYIAFAIKVPVFPFHTWLPWAHVEAPTAVSVILAGILLKMGVYGFFRLAYPMFPTAAVYFAVPIAAFGAFNIIYGACCALAQTDLKKIVAYSSVSHMGYCMLGMAALTGWGMTGSVMQMFNHGTSTAMMFLLVGVLYDRAHHRDVNGFGGLAGEVPVYTGVTTLALFASMGLPGLAGFISEVLVFLGAFRSDLGQNGGGALQISFQSLTVIAVLGIVLTAAYLLWTMQRVFFGPLNERYKGCADLTRRELVTLVPLGALVLLFGVYPQPLIDLSKNSVEATQQHVLRSAGQLPSPLVGEKAGSQDLLADAGKDN
ncbi:MAG TPA: NADH-quinone oxidoreductase subunit M [Planctomycetota bacterium]|nr:NADH-quinone oxidoreductase subunit M [Planctomycetota bacterium]